MSIENQNAAENFENNHRLLDIGNGEGMILSEMTYEPILTSGMSEGLQPPPPPVWDTDKFGLNDPTLSMEKANKLEEQSRKNYVKFMRRIGGMAAAGS